MGLANLCSYELVFQCKTANTTMYAYFLLADRISGGPLKLALLCHAFWSYQSLNIKSKPPVLLIITEQDFRHENKMMLDWV